MEDYRKNLIIEEWMKIWKSKNFPTQLNIKTYRDWRNFLEFWLIYHDLELQEAITIFLMKK